MIEEVQESNYVKKPSEQELELVRIINKYFKESGFNQASIDAITSKVEEKIKPLVVGLVRSAVSDGNTDFFEKMIKEELEKQLDSFKKEVNKIVEDNLNVCINKVHEYVPLETTNTLNISSFKILKASSVIVYINGIIQSPKSYSVKCNENYVSILTLRNVVNPNDVVLIQSSLSRGGQS